MIPKQKKNQKKICVRVHIFCQLCEKKLLASVLKNSENYLPRRTKKIASCSDNFTSVVYHFFRKNFVSCNIKSEMIHLILQS